MSAHPVERPRGLRRFALLFRLWRRESQDPEPFYSLLAAEAAEDFERRYGPRHRGRRLAEPAGGGGKALLLADGHEGPHRIQTVHPIIPSNAIVYAT